MEFNCCSETDMNRLQEVWDDRYSKYTEFNHFYFTFYIREIIKYDHEYKKKAIFIENENPYPVCKRAASLIRNFELPEDLDDHLDRLFKQVYTFDIALKKGFSCFLCDFENSKHIDMESESVYFNINVCDSILYNTFEFNDFFNRFIYKYINTVSILSHCMNSHEILEEKENEVEEHEENLEDEHLKDEEEEDEEKKRLQQQLTDAEEELEAQMNPAQDIKQRILNQKEEPISKIPGFEYGIPKEMQDKGEKLEVKPQTIQEKLREEKKIEEELKKEEEAEEPPLEQEAEIPEEEEKSQDEFEMEIIKEFLKEGNESKTFHFTDPNKVNSMDFVEIDNDYFNDDCKNALKTGKLNKIRERCVSYCHKYNLWFFTESIYRDINTLERMFENVKKFLIDDLEYGAEKIPEDVDLDERKIFKPKKKVLDVFANFNYYFGAEGVHKNSLFEYET